MIKTSVDFVEKFSTIKVVSDIENRYKNRKSEFFNLEG